MQLAIRVDVDTRVGLLEGVPRLLELFSRHEMRVTFFVSFGPDHSGRALKRVLQPGFLLKMWRTNPLRLYGLRTILSGTLLPSSPIGEGAPELVKSIVGAGHELGIHGYDHVRWQDRVGGMDEAEIEEEMSKAVAAYETILQGRPESSAAPGWRSTPLSLSVQDKLDLLYASDVRGSFPFVPVHNGLCFKTLQLPTTLPTLDELLGRHRETNAVVLSLLKEGLNVHTVHAEVEGRPHLFLFEQLLQELLRRGVEIVRLRDVAEVVRRGRFGEVPRLPIVRREIPGRSGWVACQG